MRIQMLASAALIIFGVGVAQAAEPKNFQSQKHGFRLVPVSQPLDQPWGLTFLPDGRMLVTQKEGKLRIVGKNGQLSAPLRGLPDIEEYGQGGLLDVALHPAFAQNRWVYLSHVRPASGGMTTAVSRARLTASDQLQGFTTIFTAAPAYSAGQHFGSRILFGTDGKLYVTMGDRGQRSPSQDLGAHAGSVFRLNDDGSVPSDNPFVGTTGARPEIWSYGHRNPQGMTLDPTTGRIWAHEHGPRGGDELNLIKKGGNYGWPVVTFGRNYSGSKITDEKRRRGWENGATVWVPSIAPSGLAWYSGKRFPHWKGNLFVGALRARLLARLEMDGTRVVSEERLLTGFRNRIRDVREGPDGYIYLLLDENDEPIWRMEPL